MLAEARTQTRGISPCEGNTSILNRIGPIGLELHYDAMINYKGTNIQLLNPCIYDIPRPNLGTITLQIYCTCSLSRFPRIVFFWAYLGVIMYSKVFSNGENSRIFFLDSSLLIYYLTNLWQQSPGGNQLSMKLLSYYNFDKYYTVITTETLALIEGGSSSANWLLSKTIKRLLCFVEKTKFVLIHV